MCTNIGKFANPPIGSQLKNMLERAFKWAKIQWEAAESMNKTWIEFVPGWRKMLDTYKKDSSKPNPFKAPDPGKTLLYLATSLFADQFPKRRCIGLIKGSALEGRF